MSLRLEKGLLRLRPLLPLCQFRLYTIKGVLPEVYLSTRQQFIVHCFIRPQNCRGSLEIELLC